MNLAKFLNKICKNNIFRKFFSFHFFLLLLRSFTFQRRLKNLVTNKVFNTYTKQYTVSSSKYALQLLLGVPQSSFDELFTKERLTNVHLLAYDNI